MDDALDYFMLDVVPQLHVALIWVLGIILAIVYRRAHPRRALAAGIAFTVFLLIAALNTAFKIGQPPQGVEVPADFRALIIVANHLVVRVVFVIAWLLLVQAVFGWLVPEETPEPALRVRPIVVGAVAGAVLFAIVCAAAPFYRNLEFGATAIMIGFGILWGAVAGAAQALTSGAMRGVLAGVTIAGVVVLVWASGLGDWAATKILVLGTFPALCLGALIGLGLTWGLRRRPRPGRGKTG